MEWKEKSTRLHRGTSMVEGVLYTPLEWGQWLVSALEMKTDSIKNGIVQDYTLCLPGRHSCPLTGCIELVGYVIKQQVYLHQLYACWSSFGHRGPKAVLQIRTSSAQDSCNLSYRISVKTTTSRADRWQWHGCQLTR